MKSFFYLFVRIVSFFAFGITVLNSYGQYFEETDNYFQKLNIESGLSQNKINCILRDRTGFVWFGTGSGLNRFDGKNIVVVEKDFGDSFNLKDVEIFDLYEDKDGIIWIATDKGMFRYDPEYEMYSQSVLSGNEHARVSIRDIEPENDSLFWLGTANGLKLFDRSAGLILDEYRQKLYEPYSIISDNVITVCSLEGEVWVGTFDGLCVLNKTKKIFIRHYKGENSANPKRSYIVRKIVGDKKGDVWIGTELNGLAYYSREKDKFIAFNTQNSKIPHNDIRDIFYLNGEKMWLATNGGGLSLFDEKSLCFTNYNYDPLDVNGLSNNSLYSVFEDREGILWVGFYAGGVNFKTSKINDFKTVAHLPGNANSICENNVRSLFLDTDKNLWIGTFGGLSFFNNEKKEYTSYFSDPLDDRSLSFGKVTDIFEDSKKNIWVGTYSGGVNLLKPNRKRFDRFRYNKSDSKSISGDNIYSIVEDSLQGVWVATSTGLNRYVAKSENWERINSYDIRDLVLVDDNRMCQALYDGINLFNYKTGASKYYRDNKLLGSLFVVLHNDNNKRIWFGTQGDGFGSFDLETKEYLNFSTKDGLASNFIGSIESYGDKYLWISTYKGFSLFDKETNTFVNYGLADGVPFLGFHPRSSVRLTNNIIAFGGSDGIVFFDPKEVLTKKKGSKLHFNNFKIDGNKVDVGGFNSPLTKNINLLKEIKLKYSQNDFSFDFVDISFMSKGLGDFSYKLENYMDEWTYIGDQNSVGFTNMDPGEYTLKIRKLGGDPKKGYQDEIEMNIIIVPPFWMTWYFYILTFIVFVGILILYSKYTLISINQKNEIKIQNLEYEKHEEFNRLRMKFFTYISHELRTPLTLILDPLRKLLEANSGTENYKYLSLIEKSSGRLVRLVDQILDFRKLENDTLSLLVSEKNISNIISDIYADFEEVAKSERIGYKLHNQLSDDLVGWIDSDKIEKILYNLLTNAFKFTKENGTVMVNLSSINNDEQLQIVVSDSGYGIHKDKLEHIFELFYTDEKQARHYKAGVGIGLTYVKRMVDLHRGTISVQSILNEGTSFTIVLPIRIEEYKSEEIYDEVLENPIKDEVPVSVGLSIADAPVILHSLDTPLVLIVEDETDLRNYLVNRFSQKFRVIQAVDGLDALQKLDDSTPNLVLSDNVMPGMDGIALCNEMKGRKEWSHIPFVFLSAWNSDDYKLKGLKVGAEDYISKPFQFELLEAKVESIIENRKRLAEIAGSMIKVEPSDIKIKTSDELFILRTQEIIEKYIDDPGFTTKTFEAELFMSHSVIYRKLKKLTGLSANEYIREFRLRRAAQILLQDKNRTINELCFMVGFADSKYFSQCFKKLFAVSPSEYAQKQKENE